MMQKNTKKKIAPVVVAVLVVAYVGPLVAMISYAAGLLGAEAEAGVCCPSCCCTPPWAAR